MDGPVSLHTLQSRSATTQAQTSRPEDVTKEKDQSDEGEQESNPPEEDKSSFVKGWNNFVDAALKAVSGSGFKKNPPLEGKTLNLFGPKNAFRIYLQSFLHQRPVGIFLFLLLVLNLVFLIIKLSTPPGNDTVWGVHWTDYGLLVIFIIYTLEIIARIIVSGLIFLPSKHATTATLPTHTITRTKTEMNKAKAPPKLKSFLRSTFTRMDMAAVVCFWIDFGLMMNGVKGIYIFKAVSALRTLRLINITLSNWTPLKSLKKSVPLLLKIALSIAFLFFVFSLVGVQSFKGSFTRRCVLRSNYTDVMEGRFCGGHYNTSDPRGKSSYLTIDDNLSSTAPKGYTCPENYVCKDTGRNYGSDLSFDNIVSSMIQVYILMTGQTWTDMMYKVMNSEHAWSSLYFVLVILIMNFWILNLFVAVIIDAEAMSEDREKDRNKENRKVHESSEDQWKKNQLRKMEFFWVLAIIADLIFQCQPEYKLPSGKMLSIEQAELWFTLLFTVDIAIRFTVWPSTSKKFFSSRKNITDLFLVVTTLIIQIPPIRNSSAYRYMTIFQVMRIYRPIMYVEGLRLLIRRVIGRLRDIFGLIGFIVVFLGVASVMAGLLFREIVPEGADVSMNFSDFYVSYLGMYQIFSGENWTDILYTFMSEDMPLHQIVVGAAFIIAFYSFANFVLVNMIIAIIMENFGEDEETKYELQIKNYAMMKGYPKAKEELFVKDLEGYLKQHEKPVGVNYITTSRFFFAEKMLFRDDGKGQDKLISDEKAIKKGIEKYRHKPSCSCVKEPAKQKDKSKRFWERDREEWKKWLEWGEWKKWLTWKDWKIWFSKSSLFIFGQDNMIRKFCQMFVTTGHGSRTEREDTKLSKAFSYFIRLVILASVIVAVITTPVWRYEQAKLDPEERSNLVVISDNIFTAIFTVEFVIHVIADGFILTPDAYLRTLWNQIDFFVLLSLYATLIARLLNFPMTSRVFRSIKALRALRLINVSTYIKETFHAVLVAGFPQLLDATMLCMALLVPFAIYGLRLFSGLFFSCNDDGEGIQSINDCIGTFQTEAGLTMPRIWSNPHEYSFNNFWASFLVLLEIVSQDGWIGVMDTARNIQGLGLQPERDASRYNGIFFMVFNLAGGYFVTSLFVAIVIENYSKRTGTAYMTAEQLRWKNLRQFLKGMKMSKSKLEMSKTEDKQHVSKFKTFCLNIVSAEGSGHYKKGWFARVLAFIAFLTGVILASENVRSWDGETALKLAFFFTFLMVYVFEIVALVTAFGWTTYLSNKWNIYNGVVTIFALVATLMRICGLKWQILIQVQKLLLTAVLFRLVPRNDSLNRLFMTMAASLIHILKLLGAWLVVFAVYGIIFMEVFGLSAYGPNGSEHVNFRNIGTTFLVMIRTSTGEGWKDLMHDFAMDKNLCVNQRDNYLQSDCGSTQWAYTLFITFNVISMYIFTNMFIAEVMQKFSYVYPTAQITRDDTRSFKMAWDKIDVDHNGYLEEKELEKFFGELRGVFEVRIYKEGRSIARLMDILKSTSTEENEWSSEKNSSKRRSYWKRLSCIHEDAEEPGHQTKHIKDRNGLYRNYNFNAFNIEMGILAKLDKEAAKEAKKEMDAKAQERAKKAARAAKMDKAIQAQADQVDMAIQADGAIQADKGIQVSMETQTDKEIQAGKAVQTDKLYKLHEISSVRQRRRVYEFLYHEVVMTLRNGSGEPTGNNPTSGNRWNSFRADIEKGQSEKVPGISFHKMLMILARYTLAKDESCFSVEEQLRHRQRMELLHPIVHKSAVDSIRRMIIPRLLFLMYRQKALSIRARIKSVYPASPISPASPTADQGGEKQPSGIGGGGGAPPTKRLPPVWISHKNPISKVPPNEELTADKADDEIRQLRSKWKTFIIDGDQLFDNPSVGLMSSDEFLIDYVSQIKNPSQSMPISPSKSTASNAPGHSHDQSSGSAESNKRNEIEIDYMETEGE
ncbi:MAG: Ion transport protein-domain-containing protein [Benniella sp.]|nr:MAG: Ion transport protein-domain-containing protein [Benniella sp.]